MNSLKSANVSRRFKYALLANLPLLLLPPIALAIVSSLGMLTDIYGNNWSGIILVIGLIYWLPAVLISLVLLAFSVGDTRLSKPASTLSIAYGLSIFVVVLLNMLLG